MTTLPNKRRVRALAVEQLERELAGLRSSAETTRQGAVHEENRPEDPKDMRSTETSYLARGQAARVDETEAVLARLRHLELLDFGDGDALAASAMTEVEVDGEARIYFLVPAGGGLEVTCEGVPVTLVSVSTPVGSALVGRRAGDSFELRIAGREREYLIVAVA